MEPACQFCGAPNPKWELRERLTGYAGPEVCEDCIRRLLQRVTPSFPDVTQRRLPRFRFRSPRLA